MMFSCNILSSPAFKYKIEAIELEGSKKEWKISIKQTL